MSAHASPFEQESSIALTCDSSATWMGSHASTSGTELTRPSEEWNALPQKTRYIRVTNSGPQLPKWIKPTVSAFSAIQNLQENWDSYGGKIIRHDLIKQSLIMLASIMEWNSPAPSVVPLGDGGIQIEWHKNQQDLEIIFSAEESPQFYYMNRKTGMDQEGFASADKYPTLTLLLRKIS